MEKELFSLRKNKTSHFRYPLIFFCAFILALTTLFDKTSPFAIAFIGSLSGADCAAAFVGSGVGFLMGGDFVMAVPPLIAAASVSILRIFLGRIKGTAASLGSAALTFAAVLMTNVVTAETPTDIIIAVIFAMISCGTCYALTKVYRIAGQDTAYTLMKPSNIVAVGAVTAFGIAALSSLSVGIFNIGIITSSVFVLSITYRFRFAGGAMFGIVCAFGMALASENYVYAGLALEIGAVISGILAAHGRIPQAAAFLLSASATGAILGMDETMLAFIADMLIGTVIFMALPLNRIMQKIKPRRAKPTGSDPTEIFAGRLELVGSTMGELKYAVEKTAETLDKTVNKDISSVYNSACDLICKNCRYNMKCWGEEYNDSIKLMNSFIKILRNGDKLTPDNFTGFLGCRCTKRQQLCDSINRKYDDFAAAGQMNRRVSEMRSVLTHILDTTEKLFLSMSEEFSTNVTYDRTAASKAERVLERCGLTSPKAAVRIIDGNMCIEAYGDGELGCTAEELGDIMIEALQKEFDLPTILKFGKRVRVTMFQRATYGIKSAACQLSRRKDGSNGDFVTGYIDGRGSYYSIISDGMGSGARARIDSAFACGLLTKLLESGVSVEAAIEMLNTSLLVKSSDESFATLDICQVDLYTGKTRIFKAGGADTFVSSGKTVTKIGGMGLPVGISYTASVDSKSFTAGEDDIIIMTSDGADLTERWLEQALAKDSGKNLDELVKTIAGAAKFNCEKGREDDISIVALQLRK